MMSQRPDVRHITLLPVLGILATTDVTLEALIGGLRDRFADIDDGPPVHPDHCDSPNNVRTAIALAQALQVLVARICTSQLELVASSDDYLF
jgi:hypothetical protein